MNKITFDTKWKQNGITVAGGNGKGDELNQLDLPHGIHVDDDDQIIYIADWGNHRIVKWYYNATADEIVAGGNGKGYGNNQLNWPKDVIIDQRNDSLIIADSENQRVVQWSRRNNTKEEDIIAYTSC